MGFYGAYILLSELVSNYWHSISYSLLSPLNILLYFVEKIRQTKHLRRGKTKDDK